MSRYQSSSNIKYRAKLSLSIDISQIQLYTYIHRKNHFMDQLPRHPNDGLDDSPAARVKTRTRVRRRRASSRDSKPRPATKRTFTKTLKKATVEAKLGAQAGGHLGAPRPVLLFSTGPKVEADTETRPPQTPVFGFGSPQESWQEASESPSLTKSAKFRPHSADFYLPVEPSLDGVAVDERGKATGRRVYLGPAHVSPVRAPNASKDLMDNSDPFGAVRQSPNALTPQLDESRSDAMDPHTSSSAPRAVPSGFTNGVNHMNESPTGSMMQIPVSGGEHMNGISSGPSSKPLSSTNGLFISPDRPSLSGTNAPRTRNCSTGSLEMALNGLQAPAVTEWQPASLLCMDNEELESQYALLVLNQPIQNLNMLRLIWKKGMFLLCQLRLTINLTYRLLMRS